ncbi:hypothetical protein MMJ21_07560 [Enterococcus cecorum]|uniref:ImmA/IrrE family metallo-endopeptidase n=1 Tax=Enterococcus cecorum TaxID=44008 RepID=UPI001FAC264C|nr:ImmA/IrrE family metallo-endopeptidase [Enterococcus cecorum]MCJ0522635.1 hypothetical protein [Enterococcus cecorum]MCJ0560375.1 hypothetical protein [Enterococcus cecorum]
MDKKVFLEKLYQLRENIQKVITYRKERSSIDINPDSPDAGFTVNAIYLHKGIPNAYDVFYGSLNKQGFYLAELFDLKYGDENKYDMNFYQFHMDFFNQTVDVEKLQLAENSMDKLDVMLKFTDTLLGEEQPLDKELAIDALGILNSNINNKLLSVGYRSTEEDVYIVPTNDLIHMDENLLLGITTSDRYIDKNMNQGVVNRLTHSISDENASYLITQSGAIETLWIEKQNRQQNKEKTKEQGVNTDMNPELKSKLASSSPLVRRSVLARNDLTEEAIDRLANDWDVSVRALTATNKYRLDKLVYDSEDRVVIEVLQHMYGLDVIEQNFKLTEEEKANAMKQTEVTNDLPAIEKLRVNANLVTKAGYHLEQQYQENMPFILVALAGQGYKLDELAQHENPMVSKLAKYHQNDLKYSLTGTGTKEEKLELIAKGKYRAYFLNDEDPDIRKALITTKVVYASGGYTAGYALDVLSQDVDPSVAKLAKEKIIENQMYLLPENQIQNPDLEKEQNQEPYYSVAPAMEEVEVTPMIDTGIQTLVDNHELQQWKKNPDLYFVKGLKKVAIERQGDGSFKVSEKFAPTDDKSKQRVEEILSKQTGQTQEIKEPEKDFNPLDKENISQYALDLIKNYVADPQEMKDYLDFMSKFPNLSPRNVALIQKQWHGANAVATYNQWAEYHEKLGLTADDIEPSIRVYKNRKTGEEKIYTEAKLSVKAGEKAQITLFRPIFSDVIPTLDEKGNIKVDSKGSPVLKLKEYATEMEKQALKEGKIKVVGQRKTGFTTYKVFELSQTNLKPESYPKAMPNRHYNFDVDEEIAKKMIEGLKDYSNEIGVPIKIDTANNLGNAHGAYYPTLEMILLNKNNTPTENIGTSIHELAHATLHNNKKVEASVAEFEAEMTSYIVAKSFGMDTGDKAVHYIAGWTKNLSLMDDKQLNESLSRVHKTAQKMIDTINKRMDPPIDNSKEIANKLQQNVNNPLPFMAKAGRSI